ncbi:carbohydrate ABC transporter permease [Mangrovihabitans endophyticus]|uniref:Sugar ABC transporter permease n=1 Tax=Mangrovihabitans endophyticus TaxID=1751298 RepID=A0A8J3C4G4_9ACTN|nr:carbohydrate ABC transporter permease [Mangrovihabitans endophyticus]GGL08935.1 sugar ABC transporter permease [Mangrovihabitans endophyticus]
MAVDLAARVETRTKLFNRVCLGVLIAFAVLWIGPVAWALDTALKPNAETTRTTWLIDNPTFDAFGRILNETDILRWFGSSLVIACLTATGTVFTASLAGFALSRLRFRFRRVLFWGILAGIMIPPQVLIVPQFREFDSLHLLNTFWAVSLPQIPTAVAVFIFLQFFDGLPRELEEVARMDGANFWRIYRRIVMPLARPAISAVAIFAFVTSWNDLLWPLVVLSNPDIMTIPVGLATVQGTFGIRYADTMASAILGAIPLVAVFLLFQRNIVEGIAGTGLKG